MDMNAVIFDLDNTLYCERDYVESGFNRVASYLSSKNNLDKNVLFNRLIDIFEFNGRGSIFDVLLKEYGLYSELNVYLCVYLYRSHTPDIKLYSNVLSVLKCLRELNLQLGIITDGRASVQKNKVAALDLEDYFDIIVYTDKLGEANWKPSTIPYEVALKLLNSNPDESVYIGDDPFKDFTAPKKLGMKTIMVESEVMESYWADKGFEPTEADYFVTELKEVISIVKELW
jgi:putative hydrolase of the HAD superfamily